MGGGFRKYFSQFKVTSHNRIENDPSFRLNYRPLLEKMSPRSTSPPVPATTTKRSLLGSESRTPESGGNRTYRANILTPNFDTNKVTKAQVASESADIKTKHIVTIQDQNKWS